MLFIIFPILGVVLTNLLGINILKSYIDNRLLFVKEYNELLFYITFFNCFSWLIYGIIRNDIYIFLSVICSLISCFLFIQLLYKNMNSKKLFYIEIVSSAFIIYFMSLTIVINFIPNLSSNLIENIVGITTIITSIMNNFSPMIILTKVIQTNSNSLIYLPQALIGFINLSCWLVYGVIIKDYFQVISNVISILFCFIQIIIYYYIECNKCIESNKITNELDV